MLASDASHCYANLGRRLAFPIVVNRADLFEGYDRVPSLAKSAAHVIPGHDPQVLESYPPAFADSTG